MRHAPQHTAGITSLPVNKPDPKVLQDFLALKFALSRRTAKAMIDGRSVWVNRKCVWIARYELKTGDIVEVPTTVVKGALKQTPQHPQPSQLSQLSQPSQLSQLSQPSQPPQLSHRHIRILWQNDHYLVCDKPAGLVSCDDPKSVEALLRVQARLPTLEAVHRLDRDTTGCLMFAKNHAALMAAIDMFKTHHVSKTYHAISAGSFKFAHQKIETPLDGQPAISYVTREAMSADASFLRVRIETGRTNQIRRHLASVRAPILGDRVFGLKNVRDVRFMRVARQMLHASTLELPDPLALKEQIKVHAPLPADFRTTLRLFGMGKQTKR